MKSKYYTGHVGDELWPTCGCGKRTVDASVGYKWVRVWDSLKMAEVDKPSYLK